MWPHLLALAVKTVREVDESYTHFGLLCSLGCPLVREQYGAAVEAVVLLGGKPLLNGLERLDRHAVDVGGRHGRPYI